MYKIIEDCSPYYIRFNFKNLKKIISQVKSIPYDSYKRLNFKGYCHENLPEEEGKKIIEHLPFSSKFEFKHNRVAIFDSFPKGGCGIHKDGSETKVSFNIPIEINDDKCITNWYDDSVCSKWKVVGLPYTRSVFDELNELKYIPYIKSTVFKSNEAILFNTDIYHSFDNTRSENYRKVLTIRLRDNSLSYDMVKEKLFS